MPLLPLEFGPPLTFDCLLNCIDGVERMACRILGQFEPELLTMLQFVDRFPELSETPAQFQERCAQVALQCYWGEQMAKEKVHVLNGKH